MHEQNAFITLTYDNDHLPKNNSLNHEHFQKFIRSLRKTIDIPIRYYMCGEYGDKTLRPHYHALIFGYDFPDKTIWSKRQKNYVYRSELLEKKWYHGNSEIGNVTYQSAAYTARYIVKKQNGERAKSHYAVIDNDTGEITGKRKPEYTNMSLGDNKDTFGIGYSWFKKYKSDVFPQDTVITPDGKTQPAPKYYRELLRREDPELFEKLRLKRIEKAQSNPDNSKDRLQVREEVQTAKIKKLPRELHDD